MVESETLGTFLKKERESKKIPLQEVARHTRVREHLLRAIEEDQYDLLPSTTYVRGFLFSYAKYLGVDPQEVLLRYERTLKKEKAAPPEVLVEERKGWNKKYLWMGGGVLVAILIASYFLFFTSGPPIEYLSETSKTREPPSLPTVPIPKAKVKPFSLQLKAIEETWVSIRVNGQPEKEMTFKPGEGISYQASNQILIMIGNAGGLDLIYNGRGLEKFGRSGEVVTLLFTPQGVEVKQRRKPRSP